MSVLMVCLCYPCCFLTCLFPGCPDEGSDGWLGVARWMVAGLWVRVQCLFSRILIALSPQPPHSQWKQMDETRCQRAIWVSPMNIFLLHCSLPFPGNTWVRGLFDCEFAPNQYGFGGTGQRGVPTHVVLADTPRTSTVPGCLHMGTRVSATFNMVA